MVETISTLMYVTTPLTCTKSTGAHRDASLVVTYHMCLVQDDPPPVSIKQSSEAALLLLALQPLHKTSNIMARNE